MSLSYTDEVAAYVGLVEEELSRRGVATAPPEDASALVVFVAGPPPAPSPGCERVIAVFLSTAARRDAPVGLREPGGIDATALEPEDVAERIAEQLAEVGAGAAPAPG